MSKGQTVDLRRIGISDISIEDEFWNSRLETIRETTIPAVYEYLQETGRIKNFHVAAGDIDGSFEGRYYNDSDVYKWLEAACYFLVEDHEPRLRECVDEVVDAIADAQRDDGYLNTYFQIEEPDLRWTNLHRMHELYCAGHLIEAAVAHHRATDEDRLLSVARSFADHIHEVFGPDSRDGVPGHEEIELALVKLFRVTGEDRYLDLAAFFVDQRGGDPTPLETEIRSDEEIAGDPLELVLDEDGRYDGTYFQDHAPVREHDTIEGHAVRATYLYAGATDVAVETEDAELFDAVERVWRNMTTRRMYITGGIGSAHDGERFTVDYDLPNESSYAETCAAIGSIKWTQRLLEATGESRYGDEIERALYNAFLAGISLDGERFFYANPHEVRDIEDPPAREEWFGTACCPTNVPRLLGSIGEYLYLVNDAADEVYVSQYVDSEADVREDVTLRQRTDYPWGGEIRIDVETDREVTFELNLRIPDWCRSFDIAVDGEAANTTDTEGFVTVKRMWSGDETVELDLSMPVERVVSHPAVEENLGRVTLRRGPIVYCLEGTDHERPLAQYAITGKKPEVSFEQSLLGGVAVIEGDAIVPDWSNWETDLYRPFDLTGADLTTYTAIPYYSWGNRDAGEMRIWLRTDRTLQAEQRSVSKE